MSSNQIGSTELQMSTESIQVVEGWVVVDAAAVG
jgi:hypothetical protein